MSGDLSVADVLDRAADLLEPEGAWTQGAYSRNADGSVDYNGDDDPDGVAENPVCWCALGAIAHVAGVDLSMATFPITGLARDAAKAAKGADLSLDDWNDAPERTQAEVVAKLREAAAIARATGGEA